MILLAEIVSHFNKLLLEFFWVDQTFYISWSLFYNSFQIGLDPTQFEYTVLIELAQ